MYRHCRYETAGSRTPDCIAETQEGSARAQDNLRRAFQSATDAPQISSAAAVTIAAGRRACHYCHYHYWHLQKLYGPLQSGGGAG